MYEISESTECGPEVAFTCHGAIDVPRQDGVLAYLVRPNDPHDKAQEQVSAAGIVADDSTLSALLRPYASLAAKISGCEFAWITFRFAEGRFFTVSHGAKQRPVEPHQSPLYAVIGSREPVIINRPGFELPIEVDRPMEAFIGIPIFANDQLVVGGLMLCSASPCTLTSSQLGCLEAVSETISQVMRVRQELIASREELSERHTERERLAQAVGKLQDVTIEKDVRTAELVERNAELKTMAETDGLTGLNNYRSLTGHLAMAFASSEPMALLLIDVDWFKNFNDAYGHVAGDNALKTVGQLIGDEGAESGLAFRYGGEEFALVIRTSDSQEALQTGERLRRRIERHSWPDRPITICVGAAVRTEDVKSVEDLIRRADDALYAAKRTGKNRVLAWSER